LNKEDRCPSYNYGFPFVQSYIRFRSTTPLSDSHEDGCYLSNVGLLHTSFLKGAHNLMKRREFLVSVGTAGTALALPFSISACASSSTRSSQNATINWWHINSQDPLKSAWQNYADQYMKAHPNVTIKITVTGVSTNFQQKLETAMQAGTPPDIFQSWGGGGLSDYVKSGQVQDITTALQQNGWGGTFGQGALNLYKVNGRNYGVPWDAGAVGFWYNPTLFAKATIQTPPTTWDDFLSAVRKLKAAGITPISLGEGDKWPGAFYWEYLAVRLGGQASFQNATSRKGAFTDAPFVQAGQYLQQLVALKPFENGWLGEKDADEEDLMGNSKAAIELQGQWAPTNDAATAANGKGPTFGFFPFPSIPGGLGEASDVLGGGNGFAIGKNAPAQTVDFVRFLTNATNQRALAKVGALVPPVIAAADGVTSPQMQVETAYARHNLLPPGLFSTLRALSSCDGPDLAVYLRSLDGPGEQSVQAVQYFSGSASAACQSPNRALRDFCCDDLAILWLSFRALSRWPPEYSPRTT
jgi:raffinose/stachyose/melibiose transport system substrate-binding protein